MTDHTPSLEESLRTIRGVAEKIKVAATSAFPHATQSTSADPTDPSAQPLPTFSLPPPQDILPLLEGRGLPSEITHQISAVFSQAANSLRSHYEAVLHDTCARLAQHHSHPDITPLPTLYERLHNIYEGQYKTKLSGWITERLSSLPSSLEAPKDKCGNGKHPFNHVSKHASPSKTAPHTLHTVLRPPPRTLLRGKSVTNSRRQELPGEEVWYDFQANTCLGTTHVITSSFWC
jgi:hypothetical protein